MTWIVFLVLSRQEITDWFVFLGAIGAAVFSWGLGNYQKFRATRRKEDEEDRRVMRENLLDLQKELDKLNLQAKQTHETDQ